jgi:nucleotide-binding universal stress UspA family protein
MSAIRSNAGAESPSASRLHEEDTMERTAPHSIVSAKQPSDSPVNFIVPIDFSKPSLAALRWAEELARRGPSRLIAVHAVEPTPLGESDDLVAMLEARGLERLHDACGRAVAAGIEVVRECRIGEPSLVIEDVARRTPGAFIVMGNRGLGPIRRVFLGSVADRVLRHAECPVLVVRESDEPPARPRILVATDFARDAQAAVAAALMLTRRAREQPRVALLHVVLPPQVIEAGETAFVPASEIEGDEQEARERLGPIAAEFKRLDAETTVEIARGDVFRAVAERADILHADVVALGRHGASILERILVGSTAERVLHRARCAVLTARSSAVPATRDVREVIIT